MMPNDDPDLSPPKFSVKEKQMIASFMALLIQHVHVNFPDLKAQLGDYTFRNLCNELFERLLEREVRLLVLDHRTSIEQNKGLIKAICTLYMKKKKSMDSSMQQQQQQRSPSPQQQQQLSSRKKTTTNTSQQKQGNSGSSGSSSSRGTTSINNSNSGSRSGEKGSSPPIVPGRRSSTSTRGASTNSRNNSPTVSPIEPSMSNSWIKITSPGSPNQQSPSKQQHEKDLERQIGVLDLKLKVLIRDVQKANQSFEERIQALTTLTERQSETIDDQNRLIFDLYRKLEHLEQNKGKV